MGWLFLSSGATITVIIQAAGCQAHLEMGASPPPAAGKAWSIFGRAFFLAPPMRVLARAAGGQAVNEWTAIPRTEFRTLAAKARAGRGQHYPTAEASPSSSLFRAPGSGERAGK
jgi:hypothetical protein